MTVIAWDGKTLAADRMVSRGMVKAGTTTKIQRLKNRHLVGGCGTHNVVRRMMAWYEAGASAAEYPDDIKLPSDHEDMSSLIVVSPDGRIHVYDGAPAPLLCENRQMAWGMGAAAALAAMYCGKTATEAVVIANMICDGCGNGVDTLELV